ncbi:MAG: serine/threonine-protein kinase [Acidobacteria bacterium]|nr:serine/threonine-protein kinase [Acidobacteriota bacterium]
MRFEPGTHLGPYVITAGIGAGSMGEVYRAHDPRLNRDVAIKVLPPEFADSPERRARFEKEAKAAGMINHPNVLAVHDFGVSEGNPYVVTEFLEGGNLRSHLAKGPLPWRKAVDFGLQLAKGLAAAHGKALVHRDIKPENIFVTADGTLKVLDFGLAKREREGNEPTFTPGSETFPGSVRTEPGMMVGTVGYMSPEQLQGETVDHRSDLFAFGAVFHEMLSGRRAFAGATPVDVMFSILNRSPEPLGDELHLPPGLDRLVLRCLEKEPGQRFKTAEDLAFALELFAGSGTRAYRRRRRLRGRFVRRLLLTGAPALLGLTAIALWVFLPPRQAAPPAVERAPGAAVYRQLTFRRGTVYSGRFAPDGRTVVYSACWEGEPLQAYATLPEGGGSRSLGWTSSDVASVLDSNDVVLIRRPMPGFYPGTLSVAPFSGGPPREIAAGVSWADRLRDGSDFALVRHVGEGFQLEYPSGRVVYRTRGHLGYPRISPDGALVAFIDHPDDDTDAGDLVVVDRQGGARKLSAGWKSIEGLSWAPGGKEVWFTATREGMALSLFAVDLAGRERRLLNAPGRLVLHDISRNGTVLAERNSLRSFISRQARGESRTADFSWLDFSELADVSADGRTLLFGESGDGAGKQPLVCLRRLDDSLPVQLGKGVPLALSPDGRQALVLRTRLEPDLVLLPTGAGDSRPLPRGELADVLSAAWFPDSRRVLLRGTRGDGQTLLCTLDTVEGTLRRVGPGRPASASSLPAFDGTSVLAADGDGFALFPLDGGPPRRLGCLTPTDRPLGWTRDGRSLFVRDGRGIPARVVRVDLRSGAREPWMDVGPPDLAGVMAISRVWISPDGKESFFGTYRLLSDLHLVDNVR